ncbi:Long-chain-fatty-acid--CoA ligase FadD15 [bioreactor metagenome]|uniref:Long-chain-fatty-acid--CoA ligase FadD15 n=1 Tax=bioreactor metagenome TaxID=1076179 RepID=A0A644WY40_9ZZZZ
MNTITELFHTSVTKYGNNPLIWEKADGIYGATSYSEAAAQVHHLAGGLLDIGLKPQDKVVLYSEGRTWWLLSELAVIACGAVSVPVSTRIEEAEELLFRMKHSESSFIIISARFLDFIREIKNKYGQTQKVIILDLPNPVNVELQPDEYLLSSLVVAGAKKVNDTQEKLDKIAKAVSPDDEVNICYTSGTTADPKGILLTHKNYLTNVQQSEAMFDVTPDFITLLMLPWDHSFGHTVGLYTLILKGASMAAVDGGKSAIEALRNAPINIKEIKPFFLLSVPALARNFKANIEKGISDRGRLASAMFRFFLSTSIRYHADGYNAGSGLKFMLRPLVWLGDRILFSKVRIAFGGRLKYFVGGGALLDADIQRFFNAIGVPMYQGYGLSEASPVISSNSPRGFKIGSSGKPVPMMEIFIADDNGNPLPTGHSGEIVIRGGNVMKGYWKNEQATSETIVDGWLHTGDLGYLDKDGYLYVNGRFKSLLIANDGEKYSPESLEEAMTFHSEIIDQTYLHNNQNPFTTALVHLNTEKLKHLLHSAGLSISNKNDHAKILEKITHQINLLRTDPALSKQYPARWLPSIYCILEEGFTEKNHLLNSTMKIVRPKIESTFTALFDMMYGVDGKRMTEEYNIRMLEKLLMPVL